MKNVGVLNIGSGNVNSVAKALSLINVSSEIVDAGDVIQNYEHLILPGIGAYSTAMKMMTEKGIIKPLIQHIESGKPFLGICLGMQLLNSQSEEGNSEGLNIFKGEIVKLQVASSSNYKIPHSGWNTIHIEHSSPILNGIDENDEFFFLHKYGLLTSENGVATTNYGCEFVSVIGKNNCWGVQFHPEKSHQAGLKILQNFVNL